ncbi:MAG: hypothetical protein K8S54_13795 [Spirochaetia bacterium]|nr:hypothetical protein [Spirochaetia bacterium]
MKRFLLIFLMTGFACGQKDVVKAIHEHPVVLEYIQQHPHKGAIPLEIIELSGMRMAPKGAQGPILTERAFPADARMAADDWQLLFQDHCKKSIPNDDGYYFVGIFAGETSNGEITGTWPEKGGALKMIFTRTRPPVLLCTIEESATRTECKCPGLTNIQ